MESNFGIIFWPNSVACISLGSLVLVENGSTVTIQQRLDRFPLYHTNTDLKSEAGSKKYMVSSMLDSLHFLPMMLPPYSQHPSP